MQKFYASSQINITSPFFTYRQVIANDTTSRQDCDFSNHAFTASLYAHVSELVWYKLDKMSQNHDGDDHEELPQIGPLIMDMKQQQRYILAGVLKVNTIESSYCIKLSYKKFETTTSQKINALCFFYSLIQRNLMMSYSKKLQNCFKMGR